MICTASNPITISVVKIWVVFFFGLTKSGFFIIIIIMKKAGRYTEANFYFKSIYDIYSLSTPIVRSVPNPIN